MNSAPRPELWQRARVLFERALDLPEGQRTEFVTTHCRGDVELESEVRSLVQADLSADDPSSTAHVLSKPVPVPDLAAAAAKALGRAGPMICAGQHIGEYTVLSVLGQGGMGVVYLAEQERPRRQVALKMLRGGIASEDAIRRFTYEAEVLGQLRHPGIAQVFASGTVRFDDADASEGSGFVLPYIAMELVDGARPLDVWLHEASHPLELRLSLFRTVCSAVQHGHRQGFLHRDLKPANILVDAAGQPKIIDFGIARALQEDQRDPGIQKTIAGAWLGTLAYMSPEQVEGDSLDVRSDVYALGLILFEILCGVRAVRLEGLLPDAAVALVRRGLEAVPSVSAADGFLPVPARELDWVVARATTPERERRYDSVGDLDADIERFLLHQPVSAGPPGTWYHVQKLVRRHRVATFAGAAVLLSLIIGAVVAAAGFRRAVVAERTAVERQLSAERESERSARINRFLVGMFQSVHPERDGREVRVTELLQGAAEELDGAVALGMDPFEESAMRGILGHSWLALDQLTFAAPQLERAAELARSQLGEDDPQRWTILQNLGVLWMRQGNLSGAEDLLNTALEGRTAHFGEKHLDVAASRFNLAVLLQRKDDMASAVAQLEQAHALFRELLGPAHRDTLRAQTSLASVLQAVGRRDEALQSARSADTEAKARLGPRHPVTLQTASTLAKLLHDSGDLENAANSFRDVFTARTQVLGLRHQSTLTSQVNLGKICSDIAQLDEAERLLRAAVDILREDGKQDGGLGMQARHNLAAVLQRLKRLDEALVLHDEVAAAAVRLPANHWLHGAFAKERGVTLSLLGRLVEARAELERAAQVFEASFGPLDARTTRARSALAEVGR